MANVNEERIQALVNTLSDLHVSGDTSLRFIAEQCIEADPLTKAVLDKMNAKTLPEVILGQHRLADLVNHGDPATREADRAKWEHEKITTDRIADRIAANLRFMARVQQARAGEHITKPRQDGPRIRVRT